MKELQKTCRLALWFMKSEEKRVALAKALASGRKSEILVSAKKALKYVRDPKVKRELAAVLDKNKG